MMEVRSCLECMDTLFVALVSSSVHATVINAEVLSGHLTSVLLLILFCASASSHKTLLNQMMVMILIFMGQFLQIQCCIASLQQQRVLACIPLIKQITGSPKENLRIRYQNVQNRKYCITNSSIHSFPGFHYENPSSHIA